MTRVLGRVSVVCPSRLQVDPRSASGDLFLDRALESVRRQSVWLEYDWEVIVALDPGSEPPRALKGVRLVVGAAPGQAAAVNAGLQAASGELLAVIEDDDVWHRRKMELQLEALLQRAGGPQFVSCNHLEVDLSGNHLQIGDFATPSGWLMHREVWATVGPLDRSYRWHLDNEWLGRLNRSQIPRLHLVDAARPLRESLLKVARHSHLREMRERSPLIQRVVNPGGGMARIAREPSANEQSQEEYARITAKFGEVPW